MSREIHEILHELNSLAASLETFDYLKEASDLRNLTEMIRTGGQISQRVRKIGAQESSKEESQ
jgi:hypothetical protein